MLFLKKEKENCAPFVTSNSNQFTYTDKHTHKKK